MALFSRLVVALSIIAGSIAAPATSDIPIVERGPHSFVLRREHSSLSKREDPTYQQDYTTGGSVSYEPSGSSLSVTWSNPTDFVRGIGWQAGSNAPITYSSSFLAIGATSLLSVYGIYISASPPSLSPCQENVRFTFDRMTKPLVEYYMVENSISPPTFGVQKGTLPSDGSTYTIWENTRTNEPSMLGTSTFQQYISTRKSKRSSGTVTVQNHFSAWANLGLELGTFSYQTIAVEGWSSSGSAQQTVGKGGTTANLVTTPAPHPLRVLALQPAVLRFQNMVSAAVSDGLAERYSCPDPHLEDRTSVASSDSLLSNLRPQRKVKLDTKSKLRLWQGTQESTESASSRDGKDSSQASATSVVVRQGTRTYEEDDTALSQGDTIDTDVGGTLPPSGHIDLNFLTPGALVEIQDSGTPSLAIFVRARGTSHQFLSRHGYVWTRTLKGVFYTLSNFVSTKEISEIVSSLPLAIPIIQDIGVGSRFDVPHEIAAPALKRLRQLQEAADAFYQNNALALDNAWSTVAHEIDYLDLSCHEIAVNILKLEPTVILPYHVLYAVHRSVSQQIGFLMNARYHRYTHTFLVVPKAAMETRKTVVKWLRDFQEAVTERHSPLGANVPGLKMTDNPLPKFISKAKRLVDRSREHRFPMHGGRVGPYDKNPQQGNGEIGVKKPGQPDLAGQLWVADNMFTTNDVAIIQFIETWVAQFTRWFDPQLPALGAFLLHAIGRYDGFELDQSTAYLLLQEIGVILPWESKTYLDPAVSLPKHFPEQELSRLHELARRSENLPVNDSMEKYRTDWGETEVFCIDSETTKIVDDGISLEQIDGPETQYWIHIHIANPTAFLTPDHPITQYAAKAVQSRYYPDKIFHMISARFTISHLGLQPGRQVLTFSVRVNEQAEILETKIQPGIIRNVTSLSIEQIAAAFGSAEHRKQTKRGDVHVGSLDYYVTDPTAGRRINHTLGGSRKIILEKLGELSSKLIAASGPNMTVLRYRERSPHAGMVFPTQFWHRLANNVPRTASIIASADPALSIYTWKYNPEATMEEISIDYKLVDDLMTFAGVIAGAWCKERNIPMPYRGSVHNAEILTPTEFKEKIIDKAQAKTGRAASFLAQEYARMATRGYFSSEPVPHYSIGREAVASVSSPLRTYTDMLAHYQIESAIRYEAETGKSLKGHPNPDEHLAFTREQMRKELMRANRVASIAKLSQGIVQGDAITQVFFRARYFGEGNVNLIQRGFVRQEFEPKVWLTTLEDIHYNALLCENDVSDAAGGIQVGDWWECKIESVDCFRRDTRLEPVRLVERLGEALNVDLVEKFRRDAWEEGELTAYQPGISV
ncbi:hypothetical protein MMC25_003150 [Agyrium rufum]|nr:hypothetical protein [Agyrium rufum]